MRTRVISINISDIFVDAVDELVKQGKYKSRSHAVRVAVKAYLIRELYVLEYIFKIPPVDPVQTTSEVDMRRIRTGWEPPAKRLENHPTSVKKHAGYRGYAPKTGRVM